MKNLYIVKKPTTGNNRNNKPQTNNKHQHSLGFQIRINLGTMQGEQEDPGTRASGPCGGLQHACARLWVPLVMNRMQSS